MYAWMDHRDTPNYSMLPVDIKRALSMLRDTHRPPFTMLIEALAAPRVYSTVYSIFVL